MNSKIHVLSTSPEVFDRMPIISAKLSVRVTGADKARKEGASSISEIGPWSLSSPAFEKASASSIDSENDASSIFEKAIMLGVWLSKIQGAVSLRFLRK